MSEPSLTDAERRDFWQAACEWNDVPDAFSRDSGSNAILFDAVARIKAEAVDRERAAWVAKVGSLADEYERQADMLRRNQSHISDLASVDLRRHAIDLRGLLAADDTEGKP